MAALRVQETGEPESVGTLVSRLGHDVTRIVRAEIALLQLRITSTMAVLKAAGAGLVAAGVLGLTGFGVVIAGTVIVLATVIPVWLAAFAIGGALLLVAAILVAIELRVLTHGVQEALAPVDGVGADDRHGG